MVISYCTFVGKTCRILKKNVVSLFRFVKLGQSFFCFWRLALHIYSEKFP